MAHHVSPSGRETYFPASELIVSKTDLRGRMTYANGLFCRIAGYREAELLGQPHSIIRHPDMPRCVFKLLWETIEDRREIFAFVKNMASTGDHYWVFAHVTPSLNQQGEMIGYHTNRRVPDRAMLERSIMPLYAELLKVERAHSTGKAALDAGTRALTDFVAARKVPYARTVDQAFAMVGEIAGTIQALAQTATETEQLAASTMAASGSLSSQSGLLTREIRTYLDHAREHLVEQSGSAAQRRAG